MTHQEAEEFAKRWIDAWNRHDLKTIIEHYSDDVVYTSPLVAKLMEKPDSTLVGIDQVRSYLAAGLANYPELHFELKHVYTGVNSLVMEYNSINGMVAAETLQLGPNGKTIRVLCHYRSDIGISE